MSHGPSSVTLRDVPAIVGAEPLRVSPLLRGVLIFFLVPGVVTFGYELSAGQALHGWLSFQVNFLFWFSLAAASTCFSAVFHICDAQWVRPIRRLFESGAYFFLLCPILLVVLYFGDHYLFSWASEEIAGKEFWLMPGFVYARDVAGVLLLAFLGTRIVFYSIRRDIGAIRGGLTGLSARETERWNGKAYDRFVTGWGNDARAEIRMTTSNMGRLSPVVIMAYAVVVSLIAFDQEMSVDPHWYSTMFGGFVFMAAVYLSVAWISIGIGLVRALQLHPLYTAKIERRTLHDLGKLLFGFGIFWTYLFWAHYLPIWYGNMPEETEWIITRLRLAPWHDVAWFVFGCSFIVPFLLGLSRDVKQVPILLAATGLIIAFGQWIQHYLLFVPTHFPNEIPLRITDLAITLGFLGAYGLCSLAFLAKVPLIPFGDLYLKRAD